MVLKANSLWVDSPKDCHQYCRVRIFDFIRVLVFAPSCKVQHIYMQHSATRKKLHARTNLPVPCALYDKRRLIFRTSRRTMKPKFLSWTVQRPLFKSAGSEFWFHRVFVLPQGPKLPYFYPGTLCLPLGPSCPIFTRALYAFPLDLRLILLKSSPNFQKHCWLLFNDPDMLSRRTIEAYTQVGICFSSCLLEGLKWGVIVVGGFVLYAAKCSCGGGR